MSSELNGNHGHLGPVGRLAALFQGSAITPLLALVGLLLGLFAVLVTPKEEEPQIDVTFADVYIPFPGASPAEVESLVTTPAEQVVSQIKGIDTLYSFSQPDGALLVVVFKVGVSREQAIVDLNNQLDSNRDWLPQGLGVGQPLVKPRGIDDVPIVSLTLWSKQLGAAELTRVAHELETELKRLPGTRDIYSLGGQRAVLRVMPDPAALSAHGISWGELNQRLAAANQAGSEQAVVQDNREIKVQVGQFLQSEQEARELVVGLHNGKPVYLGEVARVSLGEETPVQRSWMGQGQASYPAVTLAIGKQPGQNAVEVAKRVEARVESLRNRLIPAGVEVTVTRDYGVTAETKSNTLIGKLIFATTAVVLLVLVSMGWREALVVGVAIVITLALTLFASWAWGFTLNRVSLFALIFSIGILVDDAIVVVENIHRHRALGKGSLKDLIPGAVDEVGGADHTGDPDRDRGPAADGVCQRPDGPLHEPHPHQCQHWDAHLPAGGLYLLPLAGQSPAQTRGACRPRGGQSRALSPSDDPFSDGGGCQKSETQALAGHSAAGGGGGRHARGAVGGAQDAPL